MPNNVQSIAPSPKLDATETYLHDVEGIRIVRDRGIARRAFGAGYDAGQDEAAVSLRELVEKARYRADTLGLPFDWAEAIEALAGDFEASV